MGPSKPDMPETLVTIAYLAAGVLFIFSLGGLSAQESARRIYAAAGFKIVETIPEDNFGVKMIGEIWELVF